MRMKEALGYHTRFYSYDEILQHGLKQPFGYMKKIKAQFENDKP